MLSKDADLDARLHKSACVLREWGWLSGVSTRRAEVVAILREEARLLILLGPGHPAQARRIGGLIVAYRRLIDTLVVDESETAAI